jgi:acyl carrier protein
VKGVLVETRVKADIRQYIVNTWLSGDERGFDEGTDLQQSGILDSFSTLALVAFLDDAFKIQLDPPDINSVTFRSVSTIAQLVLDKLGRSAGT